MGASFCPNWMDDGEIGIMITCTYAGDNTTTYEELNFDDKSVAVPAC